MKQPLIPSLFSLLLVSSCKESGQPAPEPTRPAQYELTDVHYFRTAGVHLDTVAVPLKGLSVQNPGNALATQQIDVGVDDLVKTSRFEIDPTLSMPTGVELGKLAVQVPQEWVGNEAISYFKEAFSLSPTPQQQPYGAYAQQRLTVQIPAKSRIAISRQIEAYYLTCSFQGMLENKTTGQRYPLRGTWQGLLRYNNLSTALSQSPL